MKLTVVLEQSEEGGFSVLVPAHPGCISEGDTREEALRTYEKRLNCILNRRKMTWCYNRRKHTSNEILRLTRSMAWTHGHYFKFCKFIF